MLFVDFVAAAAEDCGIASNYACAAIPRIVRRRKSQVV
jgi:hypothetical protein